MKNNNTKYLNWKKTLINKDSKIEDVIKNLNETALQIALVVNNKKKLIGTITDGDIRRGLIRGYGSKDKILKIMNKKPITSQIEKPFKDDRAQMQKNKVNSIPKINKQGTVLGLSSLLFKQNIKSIKNSIIFMVGGKGKRLLPLTRNVPKPMLKIKGKPILESLLIKSKDEGFKNFLFVTGYLNKIIKKYFKNGKKWNVNIEYINEKKPLGTAGGLSNIKLKNNLPVIVANGDLITKVKYRDILNFHIEQKNMVTIAVKKHVMKNPYGVVKIMKNQVVDLLEKPSSSSYISAGIYIFNPLLFKNIKKNDYLDMSSFINYLIEKKYKINAYPLHENWLDIGEHKEYKKANN